MRKLPNPSVSRWSGLHESKVTISIIEKYILLIAKNVLHYIRIYIFLTGKIVIY